MNPKVLLSRLRKWLAETTARPRKSGSAYRINPFLESTPARGNSGKEGKVQRYRIMNRLTKEWWEGEASSAHEACQKAGWPIGDCWVRQYSPKGLGGWKLPDDAPELGRQARRIL